MATDESITSADAASIELKRFTFHGSGGDLFKITIVNILLTIVTAGIYYFWGRTRVRRYVYSQVEFEGDRFVYHGTGKELFLGWLKGVGFLVASWALLGLLGWVAGIAPGGPAFIFIIYLPILAIIPVIIVGSLRYRLSRASWRGIRFSFRGQVGRFYGPYFKGLLFTVLTIGFYGPYFATYIRRFIVENTRFGTRELQFDGHGKDLFKKYVIMFFLLLPTLGLYQLWYAAFSHRYYWGRTTLGAAKIRSTVTGGGLLKLFLLNGVIVLVTLGLGAPWATVRSMRYLMDNLCVDGEIDFASITQDYQEATATGEEVGNILDIDMIDLGFGI